MKKKLGCLKWVVWGSAILLSPGSFAAEASAPSSASPSSGSTQRIASLFVSQDFLNQQIKLHSKSNNIKELRIELDPINPKSFSAPTKNAKFGQICLRGLIEIPLEEMRAINLDTKLGRYYFQMAIRPRTTKHGHLILEFPINETFFYQADSKDIDLDRVVVPVQMLSLALASARGYLAALSGDFSTFNRQSEKIEALIKDLDRIIISEKNPDALDDLKNQRESLRLKLAAIPIERKQLQSLSRELESVLGFTGEKELSLNEELVAHKNALVLKIKLSQLVPYLSGIELGGVRILHDKLDGNGENYLAVDINSEFPAQSPQPTSAIKSNRTGMKIAPSLIVRLNQALFESEAVRNAEKKNMSTQLENFDLQLKEDGLHISGKWKTYLTSISFDTLIDFITTTDTDTFEVRVGEIKVAGIDLDFLNKFILESVQKRLDHSMKGICTFTYLNEKGTRGGALQVKVDPRKLVPAFSDLHLIGVDVRDKEFLLKIGRAQ